MYGILFKARTRQIIDLLLAGEMSLTELSRAMDMSKPSLQQNYLGEMERAGIVRKRMERNDVGREARYSLRRFSLFVCIDPADGKVVSLSTETGYSLPSLLVEQVQGDGFGKEVRMIVEGLSSLDSSQRPDYVILFGSVARGEGTWKSDIDVALLRSRWTNEAKACNIDALSEMTDRSDHRVKPCFFTLDEYGSDNNPMIGEIKEDGMVVYGEIFGEDGIWKGMKRYGNFTL